MSKDAECAHLSVGKCSDPEDDGYIEEWVCEGCGFAFVPIDALVEAERLYEAAIDDIAATFSAVLLNYTEQVFKKYGVRSPQPEEEAPSHDCDTDGHAFDSSGVCTYCGKGQFLGGGS